MLTTIRRQKSSGSSRTVKTKRCAIDCNNKKVSLDEARGIDKEGVYLYLVVCALNTDCIDKMPSNVLCDSL